MSTYAIKADKFFLPAGPQLGGYLMVEDGVFGAWQADEPSCEIKDYMGSWIAPGMVDTHIHGFYNHSTTDNDPEGIDISSTELARRGTTSWLPTTFTDGVEQIKDACARHRSGGRGSRSRLLRRSPFRASHGGPLLYHEARGRAEPRLSYRSFRGGLRSVAGGCWRTYRQKRHGR